MDVFGYRSVHLVVKGTKAGNGEIDKQMFSGFRGEIQLRTLLSHAWGEMTNDLGYKSVDSMSDSTKRRMNRVAALLELCDREFIEARSERWSAVKWREARRPDAARREPLTLEKFYHFVHSSNVVLELDLALVAKQKYTMHNAGSPENLTLLLNDLIEAGYKDTGEIEDALWERRSEIDSQHDIENLSWHRYLEAFPDYPGVPSAPRGFCLFYLLMVLDRKKAPKLKQ